MKSGKKYRKQNTENEGIVSFLKGHFYMYSLKNRIGILLKLTKQISESHCKESLSILLLNIRYYYCSKCGHSWKALACGIDIQDKVEH